MAALVAGTRLGSYEIVAPLGAGGMGEVYRARDTRLDRTVAIKVLPPHVAADAASRERFEREARAIAQLSHPHICTLHDVGRASPDSPGEVTGSPIDFLVLEHLEGETLAARLAARDPLPLEQALGIAIQVADALDQAHRHGIVHRDLKPGNIFLVRTGSASPPVAKLLDFGLAKLDGGLAPGAILGRGETVTANEGAGAAAYRAPLTAEGTILGTFQYMAPEQIEGRGADARSDVFAFGCVLYEMLTGRRAFDGSSTATVMGAILHVDPAPARTLQPRVPVSLDRVIRTCLAKHPDDRWQSTRDLLRDLRWIAEDTGTPHAASALRRIPTRARIRERAAWTLAALLALACVALLWPRHGPPQTASPVRFVEPPPQGGTFGVLDALSLSPVGRRLVFTATVDGKRAMWLRSLDAVGARALDGTDAAQLPFWSPDGRFVAFFAGSKLKRLELASGNVETISDAVNGVGGTWNADGVVLFAANPGGLMRVSSSGGTAVPLTSSEAPPARATDLWPYFLPDGRRFLFFVADGDRSGVYVGSLDSAERTRIVPLSVTDVSPPMFALPGYLLHRRERVLVAQRFDARTLALSGEPIRLTEGVAVFGPGRSAYSVSNEGVLAFRHGSGADLAQFTWFDRRGRSAGIAGPAGPYTNFALSPDDRLVAADRVDPQAFSTVWLIDHARGTANPFGVDSYSFLPVWSRSGAEIAYSVVRDTPPNPVVRSLTGSERRLLRSPLETTANSFSRDDKFVVCTVADVTSGADLWLVPADGKGAGKPLLRTRHHESNAAVSPDGRWLAFQSNETGRMEVYVTEFPVPGIRRQVSTQGGSSPKWSADGRELFFSSDGKLIAVAMRAGSEPPFSTPTVLFPLAGPFAPSRDGKRFLVRVTVQKAEPLPIQVVVDWTSVPGR